MIPIIFGGIAAFTSAATAATATISTTSLIAAGTTAVAGAATASYIANKTGNAKGHYEGEKDGCIQASKEYEDKFRQQAAEFESLLEKQQIANEQRDELIAKYLEALKNSQ